MDAPSPSIMSRWRREQALHRIFEVGIWIKGVDGVLPHPESPRTSHTYARTFIASPCPRTRRRTARNAAQLRHFREEQYRYRLANLVGAHQLRKSVSVLFFSRSGCG
jgi:hypothetical protein